MPPGAAIFARSFVVAGAREAFDAVRRFVRHGSTAIDDFTLYPDRRSTGNLRTGQEAPLLRHLAGDLD